MIQISKLKKSFGEQVLFEDVTFSINTGERLGLVGRNGHGKSTLFRILTGQEVANSGEIHFPENYKVGYLSQHLEFHEPNVLEEACQGLPTQEGGWKETYKAEAVLQGLGFSAEDLQSKPSSLSGGFQVRLNLAKLLASEPNLLLLDEPTNYLDIVSLRWLINFLKSWAGELVLITHDHEFMDLISTHTLGIHRRKVRKLAGGTEKYYDQLEMEEQIQEQQRINQEKKIRDTEKFIRSFRAKASKAKAVQSRVKALEKMEKVDKLEQIKELDFSFTHEPHPGKRLLRIEHLGFHYPKQSEFLFDDLSVSIGAQDRIGVIGRNGRGKSTLLQMIAGEQKPLNGSIERSPNLQLAYFGQTNVERLDPQKTIEEELMDTKAAWNRSHARSVAGLMMFEGDDALKRVSVLSGGEKSRVLLGKILLSPANLLLLDEPDNHLDMYSTDALMEAVEEFPGAVIMVTHSEMMLRALTSRLLVFDRGKAELFEGGYDDFLARIGWEDEDSENNNERQGSTQASKKELRRRRAEIIKQRSQEIGPLEKEVTRLEKAIQETEKEIEEDTQQLIEVTKDGFGEDGAKLSRKLHLAREQLEGLYSQLETALEKLEVVSKKYPPNQD